MNIESVMIIAMSRAPHGARGLKPTLYKEEKYNVKSRPARGAWHGARGLKQGI